MNRQDIMTQNFIQIHSEPKAHVSHPSANSLESRESLKLDGVSVLVVDDSPDNLFLVKRLLTKSGAHVDVANDGEEAVALATIKPYDIVLMDIQMPKMDGYQATRALIAQGYAKPIVALTAHSMGDERKKTKVAGFAAHLTKPLNATELLETISHFGKHIN